MATQFKKVTITAEDMKKNVANSMDCPFACALKRAGLRNVSVGGNSFGYSSGTKRFRVQMTRKMDEFHTKLFQIFVPTALPTALPNSFTFHVPVA